VPLEAVQASVGNGEPKIFPEFFPERKTSDPVNEDYEKDLRKSVDSKSKMNMAHRQIQKQILAFVHTMKTRERVTADDSQELLEAQAVKKTLQLPDAVSGRFGGLSIFDHEKKRLSYSKKEESTALLNYHALSHFGELVQLPFLMLGATRFSYAWVFRDGTFEHVGEPDLVARNLELDDFVTVCSEIRFSEEDLGKRPWMAQICGEALSVTMADEITPDGHEWTRPLAFIIQAGLRVGLAFLQFRQSAVLGLLSAQRLPDPEDIFYRVFNVVTGAELSWDKPQTLYKLATLYRVTGRFGQYPHIPAVAITDNWARSFKPLAFDGKLTMK